MDKFIKIKNGLKNTSGCSLNGEDNNVDISNITVEK